MLSAKEIRNVKFSKSMSGYRQEEVDILLDKVESDYEQFERTLREMSAKITELKGELEDYKSAQGNIQNILVSAQKFADQIVEEAKTKSAEIVSSAEMSIQKITAQEQELTTAFDKKAGERKQALQDEVDAIVATAEKKQAAVEAATQSCVERQQRLFDRMKLEIAAFKADITNKYKEHLELLSSLPDSLPENPTDIAEAISLSFDNASEAVEESENLEVEVEEENAQEEIPSNIGFVINSDEFDIDSDEDSDEQEEEF